MKQQLKQRLNDLKEEYTSGQKMLADLDARQAELRQTLLRISGAIQVLEELLAEDNENRANGVVEPAELAAAPQNH